MLLLYIGLSAIYKCAIWWKIKHSKEVIYFKRPHKMPTLIFSDLVRWILVCFFFFLFCYCLFICFYFFQLFWHFHSVELSLNIFDVSAKFIVIFLFTRAFRIAGPGRSVLVEHLSVVGYTTNSI